MKRNNLYQILIFMIQLFAAPVFADSVSILQTEAGICRNCFSGGSKEILLTPSLKATLDLYPPIPMQTVGPFRNKISALAAEKNGQPVYASLEDDVFITNPNTGKIYKIKLSSLYEGKTSEFNLEVIRKQGRYLLGTNLYWGKPAK